MAIWGEVWNRRMREVDALGAKAPERVMEDGAELLCA